MKTKYYSVKDVKIGFGQLFSQPNDDVAKRTIAGLVNDKNGNFINEAPDDKELWFIGDFDDAYGTFFDDSTKFIVKASDLLKKDGVSA